MDNLTQIPLTICLGKVTLAAGTTTTLSNTGTTVFAIKGKAYSKAAMTNAATPTTDAVSGAAFVRVGTNEGSIYVVGFDKDGNLKAAQGSVETLDSTGAFVISPKFPVIPDTMCPIGYIVIKAGSTAAAKASGWLFGTSNMSSVTGITYTFVDVVTLPERPQIS